MRQKLERLDKLRGKERKGAIDCALDGTLTIRGCPVPDPIQCSGKRSEATLDDGILMECTNVSCPFKEVPVHDFCFKAYEDNLVRMMGVMGSARGWTESQRRSNLWEKKGQALVAKAGRCRCGQGTTRRNEDAFYARQKKKHQEALEANAANGKKKAGKPKTKELSKLKFASNNTAQSTGVTVRPSRPIVYAKPVTLSYKKRSSSALSNGSQEDAFITCAHMEAITELEMTRARLPPRQVISYANATRLDAMPVKECLERGDFTIKSPLHDDSGVEVMNVGSSSTSGLSEFSKDPISPCDHSSEHSDNFMEYAMPPVTRKTSAIIFRADDDVEMTKIIAPVLSVLEDGHFAEESFNSPTKSTSSRKPDDVGQFSFNHWSPMFGFGFNLCESLIAATYLPAKYE